MKFNELYNLFGRYFLLVFLGIFASLFYIVLTPLTIYPVYLISSLIYDMQLIGGNLLVFTGIYAEIASACVAGAAYYLLVILNLTTPMDVKKRFGSLSFLILSFLAINIIRIVVFLILLAKSYEFFDFTHQFTWYFGSTIMVILIWFVNVRLFKIKDIPVYTDIKKIFGDTKC